MADDDELHQQSLLQNFTKLTLQPDMRLHEHATDHLFVPRQEILNQALGPIEGTLPKGKRKTKYRPGKFEEKLQQLESQVELKLQESNHMQAPIPLEVHSTGSDDVFSDREQLDFWCEIRQALNDLPLPAACPLQERSRKTALVKTVEIKMAHYSDLESIWLGKKAIKTSQARANPSVVGGLSVEKPVVFVKDELIYHPFQEIQPVAASFMLLVAILHLLGKSTHRWTKYLLKGLKLAFSILIALGGFNPSTIAYLESIDKELPQDIGQVCKRLGIEPPPSILYATCPNPKCSIIYSPNSLGSWPKTCTHPFTDKREGICGAGLLKSDRPIRPFIAFDIKHQVAEMVSLPSIAAKLQVVESPALNEMHDILHAKLAREFEGPLIGPGRTKAFFDAPAGEIRTLYTLSIDWMNPYGKKSSASASVGVISLACANLPPSIRYKPENLILAGIIPGPREPALDSVNHFLRPMINDFLILWDPGVKIVEQPNDSAGKLVRAAILALIADLPASRKAAGNASHGANAFCSLCKLKKEEMDNLDVASWPRWTSGDQREAAFAWKNAPYDQKRVMYKENGIRWSELFRLPYWNPTRQVVVDIMHNLFLGLIKRHFIEILGMTESDLTTSTSTHYTYLQPDTDKMMAVRTLLNQYQQTDMTGLDNQVSFKKKLEKYRWTELYTTCQECSIPPMRRIRDMTKTILAEKLQAWCHSSEARTLDIDKPAAQHLPDFREEASKTPKVLNAQILSKIRAVSKECQLPTWLTALPREFGPVTASGLKADEWCVVASLYAPLVLVQEWSSDADPQTKILLELTMDLVSAIQACTSHTVTAESIRLFGIHIKSYLTGVKLHFRDRGWVPNYHAALHITDLLEEFGPAHGWWTFPFERLIKTLQSFRNNSRLGDLEKTMAASFYMSARLRKFAYATYFGGKSVALQEAIAALMENLAGTADAGVKGTLVSDVYQFLETGETAGALAEIDGDHEWDNFGQSEFTNNDQQRSSKSATSRLRYQGTMYNTLESEANNSTVFLKGRTSAGSSQPYSIEEILHDETEPGVSTLRLRPLKKSEREDDPYMAFPLYRARIWKREFETRVVVAKASQIRCHGALWNFSDNECVVIVLDRVSSLIDFAKQALNAILGEMGLTLLN